MESVEKQKYQIMRLPIGDGALSGNLWSIHASIHGYPQPPWYLQSLAEMPSNSVSSTDLSHHLPTTCAGQATSDEIQRIGTKDKQERGETELLSFHIHTECIKQKLWNADKGCTVKKGFSAACFSCWMSVMRRPVRLLDLCLAWKQRERLS